MDTKWGSGNELRYLEEVLKNEPNTKSNPFTLRLEKAFQKFYDVEYAIAVNSGTSAIHAALIAGDIKSGDEVITSPLTVIVDASIPIMVGAKVVFADISYDTHNINPESVKERITEKTKAIIPISYHGLPYDIDAIKEIAEDNNLMVIEDDAQAMASIYKNRLIGKDADITIFSFERTKHISSGEGGMIITDDEKLAIKARKFAGLGYRKLKSSGNDMSSVTPTLFQHPKYKRYDALGLNYRLPEFCSAVALAQFERVNPIIGKRRVVAKLYDEVFEDSIFIPQKVSTDYISSYYTYAIRTPFEIEDWEKFYANHLKNNGDDFYAGTNLIYREPVMANLGYYKKYEGSCPIAEELQPKLMQFKTNYRNLEEAKRYIAILEETIQE